MERKNTNLNKLIVPCLGVIWILAFCLFFNRQFANSNYWLGFDLGVLAIVVSVIVVLKIRRRTSETDEIIGIPVYYTYIFLLISLGLDIFVSFTGNDTAGKIAVIISLLLMAAYIIVAWNAYKYAERVEKRVNTVRQKIQSTSEISGLLGELLSQNDDEQIRKQLLSLKEEVDMSTNISKTSNFDTERNIVQLLSTARVNMIDGKSPEEISKLIQEARKLWKVRNSK